MSNMLKEKPHAEALPKSTSAGVIVDGRYMPPPEDKDGKQWVRTSALVQADAHTLYTMWRDVESIPQWQDQIVSVTAKSATVSHWVMKTGENRVEWDSEVVADEPGKRIVWKSIDGELDNAGEVIFEEAPGGRGTMVTVLQEFRLGKLASAWATLTGRNPKQGVIEDLRHFKALAETGEIPRIEPQPHGDRGFIGERKRSLYGETIPTPPNGQEN
jgi:uncharacterized membrane protein